MNDCIACDGYGVLDGLEPCPANCTDREQPNREQDVVTKLRAMACHSARIADMMCDMG